MLECRIAGGGSTCMFVGVNLACTGGKTSYSGWIVLGGSLTLGSHILW